MDTEFIDLMKKLIGMIDEMVAVLDQADDQKKDFEQSISDSEVAKRWRVQLPN